MTQEQRVSRLFSKIIPEPMSGCHLWNGCFDKDGYGKTTWNYKHKRVHRVVFELAHGPISEGSLIQHICDTPSCVNIDHLRLGTSLSNMQDKVKKGRLKNQHMDKTHCKNAHEYSVSGFYVYKYDEMAGPKRVCKVCHYQRQHRYSNARKKVTK
jgi:hypothetical protein